MMKIRSLVAVAGATALTAALTVAMTTTATAATPAQTAARHTTNVMDACGRPAPGQMRCYAQVRTDVAGGPAGVRGVHGGARTAVSAAAAPLPSGLGPADLHSAYNLPTTGGANQTVGIVDAGDDPTAEADLAVYRATYNLPPCTTANGCFRKLDQKGAATPLPPDAGWGVEEALDLDMASAACPECKIVLVEGDSPDVADLAASVDTAVAAGATEVSNSYGTTENTESAAYAWHYSHPGVAILASTGDSGYQIPSSPAVYQSVIAVGGTSLVKAANARGWSETAWSGAGSGCSAWFDKPAWQTDPDCPGRMVADVSAVADPQNGVAVYVTDKTSLGGRLVPGWNVVGGTSAASPIIAGVIALSGHPGRFPNAAYLYAHTDGLHNVVGGNNVLGDQDCDGDYQCNALPGYNGPTGLGTPNGLAAF
jgi:hypothetical protein